MWLKRDGKMGNWTTGEDSFFGGLIKPAVWDEFHGKSEDINVGRGKDNLFLCSKLDYNNPID